MNTNLSKSPVMVFLALTFVLSWPFLIYGFGWFDSKEDILKRYVFSCTGMLMVALSAFITRAFVERRGFRDVLKRVVSSWMRGACVCWVPAV